MHVAAGIDFQRQSSWRAIIGNLSEKERIAEVRRLQIRQTVGDQHSEVRIERKHFSKRLGGANRGKAIAPIPGVAHRLIENFIALVDLPTEAMVIEIHG